MGLGVGQQFMVPRDSSWSLGAVKSPWSGWWHKSKMDHTPILFLPPAYVVRREGNSFTLLVCPQGGVPISHNALQHFPECHGAAGGVPCQVQLGGYPGQGGYPGWGVPGQGGYPGWGGTRARGGTLAGGYPARGGTLAGGVPWPGGYPGWGYPGLGGYPGQGVPWLGRRGVPR